MDLSYQFLWQQFAHRLVDDLIKHPVTALPGVRELEKQYKVSRPTVEHALSHLEGVGVITPAQTGKRRRVNLAELEKIASRKDQLNNRILYLSANPGRDNSHTSRACYEEFHELCERENLFLSHIEIPSEPSELRDLLIAFHPRGVVLYQALAEVEEVVLSLNIPAVGVGKHYSRIPSFYVVDTIRLAHAFEQAWSVGHRRISAPVVRVPDPTYKRMAADLKKYYPQEGGGFSRRYNLPVIPDNTVESYHAVLLELFRYTPPSCLVLQDLSHYLAAPSFLQKERLRIPADVSIILLEQDPLLADILPSVAHFNQYPGETMRHAFLALQEQMSGLQSLEPKEIIPVWVPGDSLAAPKSR